MAVIIPKKMSIQWWLGAEKRALLLKPRFHVSPLHFLGNADDLALSKSHHPRHLRANSKTTNAHHLSPLRCSVWVRRLLGNTHIIMTHRDPWLALFDELM